MDNQEMIEKFLAENEVVICDDAQLMMSDNQRFKSKSHLSAYDYKLEPMWDGLEVLDTEKNKKIVFSAYLSRTNTKVSKGTKDGATITYMRNEVGQPIRENTITDRIASGRYKITKKVEG